MEAAARVLAVGHGRARVACDNRASCGACGTSGRCALRWFAGPAATSIEIPDHTDDRQPLSPGEAVTLSVPDGEILRAAATIYLPLLAGLLLGALAGRSMAGTGEARTLLAAVAGAAAGWVVARYLSRRRPPRIGVRRAPEAAG